VLLRILVIGLAALYVVHRWVPRVRVTWPFVAVFCGLLLGLRLVAQV
jgi:hypothetical protein